MSMRDRVSALAVAVALVAAGCSGAAGEDDLQPIEPPADEQPGEPEPEPDVEPEPEPSAGPEAPPPEPIDITVVPDEITEEYVEAVLNELERLYGEAFAITREEGEVTIDVTDRLGSVFIEDLYEARRLEFTDIMTDPLLSAEFASVGNVTQREHQVVAVLDTSSDCIWVESEIDLSGVLAEPLSPEPSFTLLGPQDVERFVTLNPTPWWIHSQPVGDEDEFRSRQPCSG